MEQVRVRALEQTQFESWLCYLWLCDRGKLLTLSEPPLCPHLPFRGLLRALLYNDNVPAQEEAPSLSAVRSCPFPGNISLMGRPGQGRSREQRRQQGCAQVHVCMEPQGCLPPSLMGGINYRCP